MYDIAVALSVVLSFGLYEGFGLLTGGMVSAGYLCLFLEEPLRIVTTLLLGRHRPWAGAVDFAGDHFIQQAAFYGDDAAEPDFRLDHRTGALAHGAYSAGYPHHRPCCARLDRQRHV